MSEPSSKGYSSTFFFCKLKKCILHQSSTTFLRYAFSNRCIAMDLLGPLAPSPLTTAHHPETASNVLGICPFLLPLHFEISADCGFPHLPHPPRQPVSTILTAPGVCQSLLRSCPKILLSPDPTTFRKH